MRILCQNTADNSTHLIVCLFLCVKLFQIAPEDTEDYIEYLLSIDKMDEAAVKMADIVNDDDFVSKKGKSKYHLWHELCELIAKNPDKVCVCVYVWCVCECECVVCLCVCEECVGVWVSVWGVRLCVVVCGCAHIQFYISKIICGFEYHDGADSHIDFIIS